MRRRAVRRPRGGARAAADEEGAGVLAQPGRAGGGARVPGDAAPRVPPPRLGVDGRRVAAGLPAARERFAGPRRADRLHPPADRGDRPLRQAAGAARAGQAAVLRHRPHRERRGSGRARREPPGAADEDRGQSGPSGEPGGDGRLRPGGGAHPLRSRALADRPPVGTPRHLGRIRQRGERRSPRPPGAGRRRPAPAHRHRHLADARGADPGPVAEVSEGPLAPLGAGRRQRPRRRGARLRPAARGALRLHPGEGGGDARRRRARHGSGRRALRPRLHRRPAGAQGAPAEAGHEPPLRRGELPDAHRLDRRSPAPAPARAARGPRPRPRPGRGRRDRGSNGARRSQGPAVVAGRGRRPQGQPGRLAGGGRRARLAGRGATPAPSTARCRSSSR